MSDRAQILRDDQAIKKLNKNVSLLYSKDQSHEVDRDGDQIHANSDNNEGQKDETTTYRVN